MIQQKDSVVTARAVRAGGTVLLSALVAVWVFWFVASRSQEQGEGVAVEVVPDIPDEQSPSSLPTRTRAAARIDLQVDGNVIVAAVASSNGRAVFGMEDGRVYTLKSVFEAEVAPTLVGTLDASLFEVAISAEGSVIAAAAGGIDRTVLHVAEWGLPFSELPTSEDFAGGALSFSPDGAVLFYSSLSVSAYSLQELDLLGVLPEASTRDEWIQYVDLRLVDTDRLSATDYRGVYSWSLDSPGVPPDFVSCECGASGAALSANGHWAGFGTGTGEIVVIDNMRSAVVLDELAMDDSVFELALSDEGEVLALSPSGRASAFDLTGDSDVKVWDLGLFPSDAFFASEDIVLIVAFEEVFGGGLWLLEVS